MTSPVVPAVNGPPAVEGRRGAPTVALALLGLGVASVGAAVALIAGKKLSKPVPKGQAAKKKIATYTSTSRSGAGFASSGAPRRPSTTTRTASSPSAASPKTSPVGATVSVAPAYAGSTRVTTGSSTNTRTASPRAAPAAATTAAAAAGAANVPAAAHTAPEPKPQAAEPTALLTAPAVQPVKPVIAQALTLGLLPASAPAPAPAQAPNPLAAPAPTVVGSSSPGPAAPAVPASANSRSSPTRTPHAAAAITSHGSGTAASRAPDPTTTAIAQATTAGPGAAAAEHQPTAVTQPPPQTATAAAPIEETAAAPSEELAAQQQQPKQDHQAAPVSALTVAPPLESPGGAVSAAPQAAEATGAITAAIHLSVANEASEFSAQSTAGSDQQQPAYEVAVDGALQPQEEVEEEEAPSPPAAVADGAAVSAEAAADAVGVALADQAAGGEDLVRTALAVEEGEGPEGGPTGPGQDAAEVEAAEGTEPQSEAEAEAEQLLLAATTAWNVQGNRQQGVKLARRALDALQAGPHRAKYRSEVASSLADMLYALNRWDEALAAVGEAMEAARTAREWALAVKLSNNMGAVYKKLGRVSDAEELHRSCYCMAVDELGAAHPLALLARSNLTEALMLRKPVEAGQEAAAEPETEEDRAARDEARQLLRGALAELELEAASQEAALAAPSPDPDDEATSGSGGKADENKPSAAALLRRTKTAIVRTHIELGRLEMVAGEDPAAAEGAYRSALALCNQLYGQDSRESAGPAFSLANCLKAIGKKDEAKVLYERLYELTTQRNGQGEETAVHLARSLADLAEEAGDWAAVDAYASAALNSMTLLIGTRAHPVLESFYQAACRAKTQNGDAVGAEALRRQFLTAMLRLNQQHARQQGGAGGRGGAQGAAQAAAGAGAAGATKKSGAGKKGRK
uniref:Predicted histone H1-like nucleoprotein HC2 (HC2), homolog of Volvox carteri MTF0822/MTM1037 n=1 Tax=Yamagishiella unicocca TaxID=51707 RepID=A0A2Z5X8E1_9CHLO|nr:predicted histone H1-like nucleoprotein HC2 (HC2), homolog of Volvox carteri MTF0822/MTM1037 [Yamagishiella unicocca]